MSLCACIQWFRHCDHMRYQLQTWVSTGTISSKNQFLVFTSVIATYRPMQNIRENPKQKLTETKSNIQWLATGGFAWLGTYLPYLGHCESRDVQTAEIRWFSLEWIEGRVGLTDFTKNLYHSREPDTSATRHFDTTKLVPKFKTNHRWSCVSSEIRNCPGSKCPGFSSITALVLKCLVPRFWCRSVLRSVPKCPRVSWCRSVLWPKCPV